MQAISSKYLSLGGESGYLGKPQKDSGYDLNPDGIGWRREYEHGSIYWHPEVGAHAVTGAIYVLWGDPKRNKSREGGWEQGPLGYPLTDEMPTQDRVGAFCHFQRGSIYHCQALPPDKRTFRVQGIVRDIWAREGWERSKYGYPTSDTDVRQDGLTHFGEFQHGVIEWFPHEAFTAIEGKYAAYSGEAGPLGEPTEPFKVCPDGIGYYRHYKNGCIYWHPKMGAAAVFEPIRRKWGELDWERGLLGYPLRDEVQLPNGRCCAFQKEGGYIYHKNGSSDAFVVYGDIGRKYAALGWEQSPLGFPVSDEMDFDNLKLRRVSHFESGSIYFQDGKTTLAVGQK